MINPYRYYRKELGLTQLALAELAYVTRQVVGKTENYQYASPPPAVTYALVRACEGARIAVSDLDLVAGYRYGAKAHRQALKSEFNPPTFDFNYMMTFKNPWKLYRRYIHRSQYGFSQMLAFDLAMLQAYEREDAYEEQLFDVLAEVLTKENFEALTAAIKNSRKSQHSNV